MPTETRDTRGRFLPGAVNPAPGRPRRNPEVRLRSVFEEVLTRDELREIVRAHIDRGKAGSVASARLILEYAIGKLFDKTPVVMYTVFARRRGCGFLAGFLLP